MLPRTTRHTPRIALAGTLAEGQLESHFWQRLHAARFKSQVQDLGTALHAVTPAFAQQLQDVGIQRDQLQRTILSVQDLADDVTAAFRYSQDPDVTPVLVINGRLLIDPERVAHDIAEELAHAQQHADGVDFQAQQDSSPDYEALPYEQAAKSMADQACGYAVPHIPQRALRPEPANIRRPHGL